MSEFIYIWLYTVVQNLATFSFILLLVGATLMMFLYFFAALENEAEELTATLKPYKAWVISLFLVAAVSNVLVPSKDDVKMIVGGGLAWKATQLESVQALPDNLVNALNFFLENIGEDVEEAK